MGGVKRLSSSITFFLSIVLATVPRVEVAVVVYLIEHEMIHARGENTPAVISFSLPFFLIWKSCSKIRFA